MRYLVTLFFSVFSSLLFAQTQPVEQLKDSLLMGITPKTADTVKFEIYQQLALEYRFIDLDSTAKYTVLAKESIQNLNDPFRNATVLGYEAYYHFMKGQYDESLDLMDQLLLTIEPFESTEIETLRRKTINDQGTIYSALGMYELALAKFYELLQKYDDEGIRNESYYVALSNVGVMYNRLELFDNALEIFLQLEQEMPLEYESRMSVPVNLGFIYFDLFDYEKSKFYLYEALALEDVDPRVYGLSNFKLGQVYNAERQFERAIDAFDASIEIYREQKNEVETIQSLNGLARAYFGMGQLNRAFNFGLQGLEISDSYNAIPEKKEILESLYLITKEQGNFEEALKYFELFKETSDFITTSETTSEIERLTAEYEYRQREEQLIAENRQNELMSDAQIQRQRLLLIASVTVIFFAGLGMIGMYRSFSQKQETNYLLSLKNQEIQDQAERLRESNVVKDRIFSMIAHDLRGPLSSLYGVISLIEMKKASKEELDELIPNVAQRFKYTSTLLNNLLHWAQSQMEGYSVNPEVFDISHTVFNKKALLQNSITEKNLDFTFDDSEFLVYADLNMIDLVLQNLISNAIKYCNEGGSITISYGLEENMAVISVTDTGIGMKQDVLDKLFSKSFFTTPGTNKEKGTGLGLMLCQDFILRNHGKIWVESSEEKGSTFYFSLPIPE